MSIALHKNLKCSTYEFIIATYPIEAIELPHIPINESPDHLQAPSLGHKCITKHETIISSTRTKNSSKPFNRWLGYCNRFKTPGRCTSLPTRCVSPNRESHINTSHTRPRDLMYIPKHEPKDQLPPSWRFGHFALG
jgi:hypothetical protein